MPTVSNERCRRCSSQVVHVGLWSRRGSRGIPVISCTRSVDTKGGGAAGFCCEGGCGGMLRNCCLRLKSSPK